MSLKIRIADLKDPEKVERDLTFRGKETIYNKKNPTVMTGYEMVGEHVYIPFYYAINELNLSRYPRDHYPQANITFNRSLKLKDIQEEVKPEILKYINQYGCCIISLYTGCGKTFLSIYLASRIKLKTLIVLCNKLALVNQWIDEVEFCTGEKAQYLKPKSEIDPNTNFYIVNAQNVTKFERGFFDSIGLVIIDEVHLLPTGKMSRSLFHLTPRYMLGLSATPYRSDGMDAFVYSSFGKNIVYRKLEQQHTVYEVDTNIKLDYKLQANGRIDWGSLLESQASNLERLDIMLDIIQRYKDKVFIVLCKRVSQAEAIVEALKSEGEVVTRMIGSDKTYNKNARVLVATSQKGGVGFNWPIANALILASDIEEYWIQYLGRVFRREDSNPYIFDLVDDNPILKKHFQTRKKVYEQHGGVVKKYKM